MADRRTDVVPRPQSGAARAEPVRRPQPYGLIERFADEMDRIFDDFGFGRTLVGPRFGRAWPAFERDAGWDAWSPNIDVFQRESELVIRADLPGLNKDDVKIDVTDDTLTIQGERRREHEEERGGVYRSERSYGSFHRIVPLPEGTITEQAKASFRDGVLEITVPAPPEHVRRGRRLEITEGTPAAGRK
jgi:HSP20 family protein